MQPVLTPHIVVRDATAALGFYARALGAVELFRLTDPRDGRIGHAEMSLDGARLMLSDEYPEVGALAPTTVGGTAVTLHLAVEDVDATVAGAQAAGMNVTRAPTDESYGERSATLIDPYGHRWMIAQRIAEVSPAEMQRRWEDES